MRIDVHVSVTPETDTVKSCFGQRDYLQVVDFDCLDT